MWRGCDSVLVYIMKNTNHLEIVRALYYARMSLLFDMMESMWAQVINDEGGWALTL